MTHTCNVRQDFTDTGKQILERVLTRGDVLMEVFAYALNLHNNPRAAVMRPKAASRMGHSDGLGFDLTGDAA